jgi:membrane protease YdiL (CAAX protease family)
MWKSARTRDLAGDADRSLGLILIAVVVMTVFYYRSRVDVIAVGDPAEGFRAMTGPALGFLRHNLAALAMVGLLPLAAARLICGLRPADVGLTPGRVGAGLRWLAIGAPLAVTAAWLSADEPVMRAVYPLNRALQPHLPGFAAHVAGQLAYYVAWELLFRGILLFGLERRLGFAGANVVQTALSTLAHFGRPLPETLAAIPAGLAFGGIARHTRSIWYVVIIHLVVGAAQDWFIVR